MTRETEPVKVNNKSALDLISEAEQALTRAIIRANERLQNSAVVKKVRQSNVVRRFNGFNLKARVLDERGDVPGWVLVVLMTTGLVTAIWTIAAPRLSTILKNSLDAMNGIR